MKDAVDVQLRDQQAGFRNLYVALHGYAEAHKQVEQTKTVDLQMIMENNVTNGVKIFGNGKFNDQFQDVPLL
ncbi:unnamed protein product [Schistosoma mattheei]|uniref:Uncharacterized protein n=1 Tax=Schistosoma mattheei TaxID=31246 RepID=A0A183P8K2_9TREM|nr:unnamed protein product [Schistosoma mattheei]